MIRRLLTTRRHVPLDQADEYLVSWEKLRRVVDEAGGRAWIFRGAAHEDQFIEFIEWSNGSPALHELGDVAAARAQLDTYAAAGVTEEWEDAQ
jgi:hypothetical protein